MEITSIKLQLTMTHTLKYKRKHHDKVMISIYNIKLIESPIEN